MAAYHLAVDIGASSGRHIVGWVETQGKKTVLVVEVDKIIR